MGLVTLNRYVFVARVRFYSKLNQDCVVSCVAIKAFFSNYLVNPSLQNHLTV